jgi:hypothetical protein
VCNLKKRQISMCGLEGRQIGLDVLVIKGNWRGKTLTGEGGKKERGFHDERSFVVGKT